jgi:ParB/Sulfiredoxin domain
VADVEPNAVSDVDAAAELPPPVREGLPKSYAMRADRHYVEQLIGDRTPLRYIGLNEIDQVEATDASIPAALVESIRAIGMLQPLVVNEEHGRYRLVAGRTRLRAARAAGLSAVPCLVHQVDRDEEPTLAEAEAIRAAPPPSVPERVLPSRRDDLLAAVAEQARAIEAAERLLGEGAHALGWRSARDLIVAQARRSSWLIQAARIVDEQGERTRGREPLGATIARVVDQLEPESRLTGIDLRTRLDDRAFAVRIGSETLAAGLVGAVVSLAPWEAPGNQEPVVITANYSDDALLIEVWRASVRLDAETAERFFDAASTNRPGGWIAALGARAFKLAVEACEGDVACRLRDRDAHLTARFE